MKLLLLYVAIALGTLALRGAFLFAGPSNRSFDVLRRYVPVAALTALIVPALVPKPGEMLLLRTIAVVAGAAVAYRTKNVFYTVVTGLTAFWLLRLF